MPVQKTIRRVLIGLLLVIAVNAFGGGYYGMRGAANVPVAWLNGSPFSSYLVPSIVLFFLVGGTCFIAAVAIIRRLNRGRAMAIASGGIVLGWVTLQVIMIGYVSWLQPSVFVAGIAILFLAVLFKG